MASGRARRAVRHLMKFRATPVADSALVSAGSELRLLDGWLDGWALAARFDGEFASRAQTYAGTGTI